MISCFFTIDSLRKDFCGDNPAIIHPVFAEKRISPLRDHYFPLKGMSFPIDRFLEGAKLKRIDANGEASINRRTDQIID